MFRYKRVDHSDKRAGLNIISLKPVSQSASGSTWTI